MNLREELFYNTWPEVSGLTGEYKTKPKRKRITESSDKGQHGQLRPYLETIKSLGIYNDSLDGLDDPEELIETVLDNADLYKNLLLSVHRELQDRALYDDFLRLSGAERDFLDADEDTEDIYTDIFDVIGAEIAKLGKRK